MVKETSSIKTSLSTIPNLDIKILRASDIVKTGKNLRSLAEYLLGTLLIVDNLNEAIKITVKTIELMFSSFESSLTQFI